ncbi:uncharacterized protein LOC132602058 [Lycium barbarum]|uniref:uncharacterized protein LOC132602058 n=1 Tax=Lycium barbarum TaxID=112863 RepID=UPI00293E0967|nr:uncharacterized protein LOC132602058 [Lycium barbarum]
MGKMAYRTEKIEGIKIKVFKWIQSIIKNHVLDHHHQLGSSSKFGFLVLRLKNQIKSGRPKNCCSKNHEGQTTKTTFKTSVQPFKICESPYELVENIELALGLSDLFFNDTIPHLANTIFDYLSSSFEIFGKKLDLLGTNMDDDEFHKIVVAIDVDMQSERFEIRSQSSKDICSFKLTDLHETLVNDGDNYGRKGVYFLQVVEVQESCGGVSKKKKIDVNMQGEKIETESQLSNYVCSLQSTDPCKTLANYDDSEDIEREFNLQVDSGINKKRGIGVQKILVLELKYNFDDSDIQEILDTLFDFLTKKRGFRNKVEVFDGKIQKFREVKSGLKIVNLKKENVVSFELGDICPVCFEIFEEKSVVVITPCSHLFHRRCIFPWLSENDTCPTCREICVV